MDGAGVRAMATLGPEALARLMPMMLWLSASGHVVAAGPTLVRYAGADPAGARFLERFEVRRPRPVADMADLRGLAGQPLALGLRGQAGRGLRGLAVPAGGDGRDLLVNLSFGIGVADAVREHDLSSADFAPTDLTVELLYLSEAKAAVSAELAALNRRLDTAHRTAEARALTDPLTGLANRRACDGELARECRLAARGGAPFALLHLDLDRFKAVNDTLGHAAGDTVLTVVADRLREETRRTDTVARVGGDEFVILLRGEGDALHVQRTGARIISELERPILHEGQPCLVSASVGAALSADYALPQPAAMQTDADAATYAAKRAGRGRCVVRARDGGAAG